MKLPHREKAYIPPSKLTDYLLSETHPIGRSKARFLRAAGFDETNVEMLAQGLMAIAHSEEVEEAVPSPHGMKYAIDGTLQTPTGSAAQIRTVWIIDTGQDRPRFITAYPVLGRRSHDS